MGKLDTIQQIVTIFSQLPIEKVLIRRPYVEERPFIGGNISQEIPGTEDRATTEVANVADVNVHDDQSPLSEYAGTSQISAAGKACIPCGNDHFSTVTNLLSEAKRFAIDNKTLDHPEIIIRIAHAEDELNGFEREDGAPGKVVKLPPNEKKMMDEMLIASRQLRHELKELTAESSLEDLERVGALADDKRRQFRTRLFRMQMGQLNPEQQAQLQEKIRDLAERGANKSK